MRYESSVTSLSWIPSEAVTGSMKAAFESGLAHYDNPPPDELTASGEHSLAELEAADKFRFANVLTAWVETDDSGRITGAGYADDCGGRIGATTVAVGPVRRTFQAVKEATDKLVPVTVGAPFGGIVEKKPVQTV